MQEAFGDGGTHKTPGRKKTLPFKPRTRLPRSNGRFRPPPARTETHPHHATPHRSSSRPASKGALQKQPKKTNAWQTEWALS